MLWLVFWLIGFVLRHVLFFGPLFLGSFGFWIYNKLVELERLSQKDRDGWLNLYRLPPHKRGRVHMLMDDSLKTLSLIMPVYNEEKRLPKTLDETIKYLEKRRGREPLFTYEIILVNDGSRDGSEAVATRYMDKYGRDTIRLINYEDRQNQGKGFAVKVGMSASRGRRLLMLDADAATEISDLERLEAELAKLIDQKYGPEGPPEDGREMAMVVGSRAHMQQEAVTKRAWYRNITMHGFHALVIMVVGNAVRDTQCGFKLFTREAARVLFYNQRLRKWCFDVELIRLAQTFRVPVAEVAVNWTEVPGSKLSLVRASVNMALELLMLMIGYNVTSMWVPKDPRKELAGVAGKGAKKQR